MDLPESVLGMKGRIRLTIKTVLKSCTAESNTDSVNPLSAPFNFAYHGSLS